MHPIEHLRYLARACGIDDESLVREAAMAIGSLPNDPAMMVVVCRRLLDRHPTVAPLWWLCSSVVTAAEPVAAAWELEHRFASDDPYRSLAAAVAPGSTVAVSPWSRVGATISTERDDVTLVDVDSNPAADVWIVEPVAVSPNRWLGPDGNRIPDDTPIWLCCRLGTRHHDAVVSEIERRADGLLSAAPIDRADAIVDRAGRQPVHAATTAPDGPLAAELLRTGLV